MMVCMLRLRRRLVLRGGLELCILSLVLWGWLQLSMWLVSLLWQLLYLPGLLEPQMLLIFIATFRTPSLLMPPPLLLIHLKGERGGGGKARSERGNSGQEGERNEGRGLKERICVRSTRTCRVLVPHHVVRVTYLISATLGSCICLC